MSWLQTYSGVRFDPLNPKNEDIRIIDVAHALSMQCRFNGHCLKYYSVAEHSVRVARILPEELKIWGLLHDAAEAYISDLIRPVKDILPGYDEIEDRILKVVSEVYDLKWPMPSEIKKADNIVLMTEKRDLLVPMPDQWTIKEDPLEETIEPWPQEKAMTEFLRMHNELEYWGKIT